LLPELPIQAEARYLFFSAHMKQGWGSPRAGGESALPLIRPHPGGVAAESPDADEGEALLARLSGAAAAQLDGVPA